MKVYIAGPMTGLPEHNFPAFAEAAQRWRDWGWKVYNPAEKDSEGVETVDHAALAAVPWEFYLRRDLLLVLDADAVAVLPGWEKSRGANLEVHVARSLNMPIYDAMVVNKLLPEPEPETPLQEAQRLVHGPRGADYGHPIEDFTRTGRMWGAILNLPEAVPPDRVALCMIAVKISREVNAAKRDNIVDIAGYAETLSMVRERQQSA